MTTQLTHFTNTAAAVGNILEHGFAWMRNDREVIRYLLPGVDFSKREPQSFGQICFTENQREINRDHTKFFGSFGIEVKWEWARCNNVQPVIYIPQEGPLLEAFKSLFKQAYQKAKAEEKYPNDKARQMWETSAAMAGVQGVALYANLLTLYQYMEPARYSGEREWRITNPDPNYNISQDLDETLAAVSPPHAWAQHLNVVKVVPEDIVNISCEKQALGELLATIPKEFKDVPVKTA